MMQNLLIKRFGLKLHHETRDLQVYELTVGQRGAKLKEFAPESLRVPSQENRIVDNRIQEVFKAYTMPGLAGWLSSQLAVPVFDATRLEGTYDLTLDYTIPPAAQGPSDPGASKFFAPIEAALADQFGLRLQHVKRQLDVLVIDHAEREPTEN